MSESRMSECWVQWKAESGAEDAETFQAAYMAGQNDPAPWRVAEIERAAAARAWDALADAAYPLYEAAEAVLLHGADKETLLEPLGRLGAQSNPYRAAEIREGKSE